MKMKIYNFFIVIIFLIIFFIFYKGLNNTNIYTPKVELNKNIPSFKAREFESNNIIISNDIFQNDKLYLLNIWASWCIPCRDEHRFLLDLSNQKNIEIIGLNYKDKTENAKKFLKELNSPYELILSDDLGIIAIEWGAYGVPESFLIDNKKIIKKFIGPLDSNKLKEIKSLIR